MRLQSTNRGKNSRRLASRARTPYTRPRIKFGDRIKNVAQTFLDGPEKLEQRITDDIIGLGKRIDKRFDKIRTYVKELEDIPKKATEWVGALTTAGVALKSGAVLFGKGLAKSKVGQMAISEEEALQNALYNSVLKPIGSEAEGVLGEVIPFTEEFATRLFPKGMLRLIDPSAPSKLTWLPEQERAMLRYLKSDFDFLPEALPDLGLYSLPVLESLPTEALVALAGLPLGF